MIPKIEHFRNIFLLIHGWRRVFLLFLLGALCVLALPPIYLFPVLIPAFTGLVWLLDGSVKNNKETTRWNKGHFLCQSAFITGWWFGLGYFSAGLYWISFSLLVEAQKFGWLIPIVIFTLSAFFAIYIGLVTFLSHALAPPGPRRVIYIIIFWVVFEWIRSWLFTGFPWNLLGTIWTFNEPMMQFASVFGVFGLSLVTIGVACIFSFFGYTDKSLRFKTISVSISLVILFIVWAGGYLRLFGDEPRFVNNVVMRLVQPNIRQKDKWIKELRGKHLNNLIELSTASLKVGSSERPTHIIWPETATPFFLEENKSVLRRLSQIIPPEGALITGSPRRKIIKKNTIKLWNSLHVVNHDGEILSTYDKSHLVPFGEYIPLRKYLDGFFSFVKLTKGRIDFSNGSGHKTIMVPSAPPVSPLICYEVIFSGQVTSGAIRDVPAPGWLLNITNDAWFGISSGPYQHLATAQLRAVEEGLPLVRVANTGISAVIDGYGRVQKASTLNQRTYIDSQLPAPLKSSTIYSKLGIAGVGLLMIGLIVLSRFRVLNK
jgi:apolipoprotein N-acyltransferase